MKQPRLVEEKSMRVTQHREASSDLKKDFPQESASQK